MNKCHTSQVPPEAEGRSASRAPESPDGTGLATGGLLAVVGAERSPAPAALDGRGSLTGSGPTGQVPAGPVATALVELCRGYVESQGTGVAVEGAANRGSEAAPGWLIAVAIACPFRRERLSDALELAIAAGTGRGALGACVAYVELAAGLFARRPMAIVIQDATSAIRELTGASPVAPTDLPRSSGVGPVDALVAGTWALAHPACEMAELSAAVGLLAGPEVAAAVAGLLGLRDGADAIPTAWQRHSPLAAECVALAPELVRARNLRHVAVARPLGTGTE